MNKNIILCADGTGNRGGETPDTNVYRMYNAVDLHQPTRKRRQITFYDNGVGTSTNKYIRGLTGALGLGFGRNIRDLYEYLARNYNDGDIVYLFGFSRGAATVRAFAGMLQECGLVDRNHDECKKNDEFDYDKFIELIKDAFGHYQRKNGKGFKDKSYVIKEVRIKFLGIWDTVSALGFPYHRRTGNLFIDELLERPVPAWFARILDRVLDFGPLAHNFYNYIPNDIVDHVYHAIAIDDERKSFWPRVWDEEGQTGKVTQVWFAGMHSDVGGSYNQTGLAYVTMQWMMERAEHHGLDLIGGALQEAKDMANTHGRLHDSRDGLAIYFRYAPRNIEDLCKKSKLDRSKLSGPIKIHKSVMDRMERATYRYAPGLLPTEFEIVDTPIPNKNTTKPVAYGVDSANTVDPHVVDKRIPVKPDQNSGWEGQRNKVKAVVRGRRILYRVFADFSFAIFVAALWLWSLDDASVTKISRAIGDTMPGVLGSPSFSVFDGNILRYLTPQMFDNFIKVAWVDHPIILVLIVLIFIGLFLIKSELLGTTVKRSVAVREKIRRLLSAATNLADEEEQIISRNSETQNT